MNDPSSGSHSGPADVPGDTSEDHFIAQYFAPIAGPGALGLRDDAAMLTPPAGCELVVTVDTLVAGVHFFDGDPPDAIARKALRVNLSDLAAKGADPAGFLLSFAMPHDDVSPVRSVGWLPSFAAALAEDAARYKCPLLGGDTVSTPGPLTLSVTAFGFVPNGTMVLRTGARAGDLIYVTGTIGDGALGLQVLLQEQDDWVNALDPASKAFLIQRYRIPQPRNDLAGILREHAHGAMDVSDGLAGDLAKMMRVSGTAACVETARIPLSDAAKDALVHRAELMDKAITGGDDYEILCTIEASKAAEFETQARAAGIDVTRIGEVVPRRSHDAVFVDSENRERVFARGSWSHF